MNNPTDHGIPDAPDSFTAEGEHRELVLLAPLPELGMINLAIVDDPSGVYADIVLNRGVAVRLAQAILDAERSL